jgi:mannosyltransferase OCH1-like enzyme
MSIPKIIHHIAPENKNLWHPIWEKCYPTWQNHFPDHEHVLWKDEQNIDNFVKENYSKYWQLYQDFPAHINRLDFVRFCILHKHGGIYADMDMFCYKNFYQELNYPVQIVEAPYGDEFLESSLMISEPGHQFWIDCMEMSMQQYYTNVKQKKIKIPFNNDRATQYILQSVAGPNLICRVWKKWQHSNQTRTLPGVLYNNHGMSYHPEYRTKHLMTGMWGKESLEEIIKDSESVKSTLAEGYMREMRKYVDLTNITVESFDFYKDYTNGGMKKYFVPNLSEECVNEIYIQYG